MTHHYQPIIIIGAARSGTKLIRDLIAQHPAVDKVPYDMTYIWHLGNEDIPHDQLPAERLTPQIRQRILKKFEAYHAGAPYLVEKTVGNCLRVPFVQAVFPQALFIHLVRDGRDVVESVYRQWLARPDWGYILAKARTFPLLEAFGYALAYAGKTGRKLLRPANKQAGIWGVRYPGIETDMATRSLLEVCAIQWVRSVEKELQDLRNLPVLQVLTLRYEDFVQTPRDHLKTIAEFAGLETRPYLEDLTIGIISLQNIGKGFRNLNSEQIALVMPHLHKTLSLLGYTL